MFLSNEFYKRIYSDDIIYHYTKASTAIDYILFNNQLKFNNAINSIDPIESIVANRSICYKTNIDSKTSEFLNTKGANRLSQYIKKLQYNFLQVSFCKNKISENFSFEDYSGQFENNEEIFGFTKPRMWDQYADKYSGVCIALSKSKILKLNNPLLTKFKDDVKYKNFNELSFYKVGDIDNDYLNKIGYKKYKQELKKKIIDSFFYKHIDYIGEDEYRIGTFCNKKSINYNHGNFQYSNNRMLDIESCIEAIFFSSFANEKQKDELHIYAKKFNIPIIEINWNHDSINPYDYNFVRYLSMKIDSI